MKKLWIIFLTLSLISLVSASYSDCSIYGNCKPVSSTSNTIINYQNLTSNSSDFWDSLDTPNDITYDDLSGGDVNAAGYFGYFAYLIGAVGGLDINGDPWYLGNASLELENNLTIGGFILSHLLPYPTLTLDLGSGVNRWRYLYVQNISSENIDTYTVYASDNITTESYFIGDGSNLINTNVSGDYAKYQFTNNNFNGSGNFTGSTINVIDENNSLQIDGVTILRTGTSANENIFLGKEAFINSEGESNVGMGFQAGYNNNHNDETNGTNNFYLGYQCGYGFLGNNYGYNNVGIGRFTLYYNQKGYNNVGVGSSALITNTDGTENTGVGYNAVSRGTTGNYNTGVGSKSLYFNVVGGENTGVGYKALYGVSGYSYSSDTAIGSGAGLSMKTGTGNSLVGRRSGYYIQDGDNNVGVGYYSLGFGAGSVQAELNEHTTIGAYSGYNLATGSTGDVFLGFKSGYRQTTGSNLLIIDNQDRGEVANESFKSLIYGQFSSNPLYQNLTINAVLNASQKVYLSKLPLEPSTATALYVCVDTDGHLFTNETKCRT